MSGLEGAVLGVFCTVDSVDAVIYDVGSVGRFGYLSVHSLYLEFLFCSRIGGCCNLLSW